MTAAIEILTNLKEKEYNWTEKFKKHPETTSVEYYKRNSEIIEIMLKQYYNPEEETITLNGWDIEKIMKSSVFSFLPNSASFFKFFKYLGFYYKIISYHIDEAPVCTYEFKVSL